MAAKLSRAFCFSEPAPPHSAAEGTAWGFAVLANGAIFASIASRRAGEPYGKSRKTCVQANNVESNSLKAGLAGSR